MSGRVEEIKGEWGRVEGEVKEWRKGGNGEKASFTPCVTKIYLLTQVSARLQLNSFSSINRIKVKSVHPPYMYRLYS